MKVKIYHNPRCSKSRQTLKLIQDKTSDIEIVEYLKQQPDKKELKALVKMLGIKPEQLVRKKESIFLEKYKTQQLSDEQYLEAMAKYPVLMERPVVVVDKKAVLGRPPENIEQLF